MNRDGFIPFHRPSIGEDEIAEVTAVLRSGWLTSGPRTGRFEEEFRDYAGAAHALAVSSGTAALHLALTALGIGPGDEVITSPLTFCATVLEIMHVGATPVLADVGADGNVDPNSVAARITGRTRAIMPVHLGGLPCRMEEIAALAREHGLRVIEDAAHAAGSRLGGRPIGSCEYSDVTAFSFYATKNLTTGEGGMITTNDSALAGKIRLLRLHGIARDSAGWAYEVREPGFKYNLSDIHAAIGLHQLRKLEGFVAARTEFAAMYDRAFADLPELEPPPRRDDCRHSWHLYTVRLNLDRLALDRTGFIRALRQRGVEASVHFIPIPLHPFFRAHAALPQNHCPRAAELYPRLVSLPLYPGMTADQVARVAGAVREIVGKGSGHRTPVRKPVSEPTFLVTGAAGSIGSALCRRLAGTARVVALDQAESELHKLSLELGLVAELADIRDREGIDEVMARHRPDAVIHAAAYKHVPVLESHAIEAARNNVLGTWHVAEAARRHAVRDFLLISSDKAVNPAGLMGMTKRAAEQIIAAMPEGPTRFASVRFGNVLGSNGSVVPLFEQQIAAGGPVTVTHPEARRYFMTVGEAVDLILEAFAMKQSGTFVLDMGEPVSILDLARRMIAGRAIEIEIIGLRPGEKLVEELLARDEEALPTGNERVRIIRPACTEYAAIERWVRRLEELLVCRDREAIAEHLRHSLVAAPCRTALATNRS